MSAQISELVRRWDDQQAAYIADREKRFDVILDVLELQYAHTPVHGRRSGLRAGFTERPDSREVRACERCGDRLRPDAAGARPPVVDAFR